MMQNCKSVSHQNDPDKQLMTISWNPEGRNRGKFSILMLIKGCHAYGICFFSLDQFRGTENHARMVHCVSFDMNSASSTPYLVGKSMHIMRDRVGVTFLYPPSPFSTKH